MEMNTRLQVEHTVTEAITGLDLVEWQLRVAAGERLPRQQEEVRFNGHAIEARVCAEDPERGFLPSAGTLQLLEWPAEEGVRVDAGFATGDRVPDTYDSLLGKVIAWAPERRTAAAKLAGALTRTYSAGVHTNERWLARILRSQRFLSVEHNIALLDGASKEFAGPAAPSPQLLVLAALATHGDPSPGATPSPWAQRDGFTPNLAIPVSYTFAREHGTVSVDLTYQRGRAVSATLGQAPALALEHASLAHDTVAAVINGVRHSARYLLSGTQLHLWSEERSWQLAIDDPRTHEFSASAASGGLTTPLPGVVVAVAVQVGQKVASGETLIVIEAMKMEHTITAPYAGTVEAVFFARGDRVPEGSLLLGLARES